MTYCVAVTVDSGLVMASDSRTHAGVDHVASFCKMRVYERPGERVLTLLCAGNLAVTQGAINCLEHQMRDDAAEHLLSAFSMDRAASLVGRAMREVQERDGLYLAQHNIDGSASFLLGGQIRGERHRMFHVYTEGNFIEATAETPFFQIGETKYAKPILDRVITRATGLPDAAKCVLVSFDATMRSNISVGPPIDIVRYERDTLRVTLRERIGEHDPYLQTIRREWETGLLRLFAQLPEPPWETGAKRPPSPRARIASPEERGDPRCAEP
jgi:putative proteasome-type protease